MDSETASLLSHLLAFLADLQRCPPHEVERGKFEVKSWCTDERELWKEVCDAAICLANSDGGLVLVGPKDRELLQFTAPCPHPHVSPEWLKDQVQRFSVPPVECSGHWLRDVCDHVPSAAERCIIVAVPRRRILGLHRTHRGVCLVRHGDSCDVDHLAPEDDYTGIAVERASIASLSRESMQWAFKSSAHGPRSHLRWRSASRSVDDLLVDFGLVRSDGPEKFPTLASLLLFGTKEALARLTEGPFFRITVTGLQQPWTDPFTVTVQQNVADTLRDIWTRQGPVYAHAGAAMPEGCFHELIVNALIHRSYRALEPINIRIAPGRLFEIQNPGGFLRGLNPQNLINCSPVHRNRLLTEAVALLGFCEKSGSGIDIVYQEALAFGHDFPYFAGDAEAFSAMLPLERHSNFAKFVQYRGKDFTRLESLLMIKHLHKNQRATLDDLARIAQRPPDLTRDIVRDLVRRQILVEADAPSMVSLSAAVMDEIERPLDRNQPTLFGSPLR